MNLQTRVHGARGLIRNTGGGAVKGQGPADPRSLHTARGGNLDEHSFLLGRYEAERGEHRKCRGVKREKEDEQRKRVWRENSAATG